MADVLKASHDAIVKELTDRGRLIEVGWQTYEWACYPSGISDIQRSECRQAFFSGAQHLLGSIMGFLEEGDEPTEADLRRMVQVEAELEGFLEDFKRRHGL